MLIDHEVIAEKLETVFTIFDVVLNALDGGQHLLFNLRTDMVDKYVVELRELFLI